MSGSLLAKYFVKKGDLVDALPIVGDGENYKKVNIRIIGKTKKFRTGGIGYNSFSGRIFEIFVSDNRDSMYLSIQSIKKKYRSLLL